MLKLSAFVTVAIAAGTIATSCGGDDSAARVEGTVVERTTTSVPTTTTPPTTAGPSTTVHLVPPATQERVATGSAMDWEGQRYDFGTIHSARVADDQLLISFDRMQLYEEDGTLHSGPTLSEEPIIVANTDMPFLNQSRALRTFSVAPDAMIKRLSADWTCGPEGPAAPTWDEITFDDLAAAGIGDDTQDSLTFDGYGQVVQIRLSRSC